MNILRFEMNVPAEVALQSSEGISVEGRYGTRKMFTLTDGRVMYVPPIVASKIEAAGIAPGESFQLCKASVKTGQRRSVEWLLDRDGVKPDKAVSNGQAGDADTQLERDLRLSIEAAQAKEQSGEPARSIEEVRPSSGLKIVPNGASVPITKLEHALKTAISAAHNAEKFGSELGYVVRFDADAIKSMAITVLINMSERVTR